LRVLAVHADVVVAVSRLWQTTCTAIRSGGEGFVIDSPIFPDELEALPAVLEQAEFPVSGLLATHADWDHLLGRLAFPDASLGLGEATASRLASEPGAAQRSLRDFDDEHYVRRPAPLALATIQALPVPGRLELGAEREIELHPAHGHTADGTAYWVPWARVLVCGDYLSPVEIPMISSGGSSEAYESTLGQLRQLVEQADTVVPGHGEPLTRDEALRVLDEDLVYLDALGLEGDRARLPPSRRTSAQRRIHAANVAQGSASGADSG
jgi:glyoxylase-like metal-dependent hydrolase (beta-lactamase superfamily II)